MRGGVLKVSWPVLCAALTLSACDSAPVSPDPTPEPSVNALGPNTIVIEDSRFNPEHLAVSPGETVRVINRDSITHSVTSEAVPGDFRFGEVNGVSFDTGSFTGERTFEIPTDAPPGTVVTYFCTVHGAMMSNRGEISIE